MVEDAKIQAYFPLERVASSQFENRSTTSFKIKDVYGYM